MAYAKVEYVKYCFPRCFDPEADNPKQNSVCSYSCLYNIYERWQICVSGANYRYYESECIIHVALLPQ